MEKVAPGKENSQKISKKEAWTIFINGVAIHLYNKPFVRLGESEKAKVIELARDSGEELFDAMLEEDLKPPEQKAIRAARKKNASAFLYNYLLPGIAQGRVNGNKDLDDFFGRFREENSGPGSDFEHGIVFVLVYEELFYDALLARKGLLTIPDDYPMKKALDLLTNYNEFKTPRRKA